jgi:hypothetical protein
MGTGATGRRAWGGAPPRRKFGVMFLGAGASKAAGLPLTEELLQRIWPREHEMDGHPWARRRSGAIWNRDLKRAAKVLYPDGDSEGFRPLVSEFFTLIEVMDRVHSGRERLALDAGSLLRDLRAEIAEGLLVAVDDARRRSTRNPQHAWLTGVNRPQVIITSNWDTLVEQTAFRAGVDVHLRWPRTPGGARVETLPSKAVVVLKLHGSIDWGRGDDSDLESGHRAWEYERLDAPVVSGAALRQHHRTGEEKLLRYRTYDHPVAAERGRSGFAEPLMATMAAGKDTFISDLQDVWDDAYWALSRAARLDIVGYSFPPDDLELRTLLRVTTRRPGQASLSEDLDVYVCNPSPDTHDRARSFLGMDVHSSYEGAGAWRLRRRGTRAGGGS